MAEKEGGKIVEVELSFPGKLKDEPVFYNIIKKFDIIPSILEASFSTDMGWAIVKFEGKEKEINRLFNYLKLRKVKINIR